MSLNDKSSITVILTFTLLTGFLSIAYIQRAHAFSIDFSGLPGFGDSQGLNFFKGPKGDIGPAGLKGDTGATGAPCPHQSKLASQTGDGHATVDVLNPSTPGDNNVCVP